MCLPRVLILRRDDGYDDVACGHANGSNDQDRLPTKFIHIYNCWHCGNLSSLSTYSIIVLALALFYDSVAEYFETYPHDYTNDSGCQEGNCSARQAETRKYLRRVVQDRIDPGP